MTISPAYTVQIPNSAPARSPDTTEREVDEGNQDFHESGHSEISDGNEETLTGSGDGAARSRDSRSADALRRNDEESCGENYVGSLRPTKRRSARPGSSSGDRTGKERRKPWFRCHASELLGDLGAMDPDSICIYMVLLLRIFENDGPVSDDARVLSRRTSLSVKRVVAALESLIGLGFVVRLDSGRFDIPATHAELAHRQEIIKQKMRVNGHETRKSLMNQQKGQTESESESDSEKSLISVSVRVRRAREKT
jgi:hypothetical protein